MSKDFYTRFLGFIKEHKLVNKQDRIIIAVSGGLDSTVLLYLMKEIREELELTIIAVHINYQLRDGESDRDEKFIRELCLHWSVPLICHRVSIHSKSDVENNARQIRFQAFNKIKDEYAFNKVALGHNKNDQVETLLLHLFRGAGITGLRGILPNNNGIIHPLLAFTREEIMKFANENNIVYCQDTTNDESIFERNKIRHQILPLIEQNINPNIIDRLANTTEIFRKTDLLLREKANILFTKLMIKNKNDKYIFPVKELIKENEVILFYFFRKIFALLTDSEKDFYQIHFEDILSLIKKSTNRYIRIADNVYVLKKYKDIMFLDKEPKIDISSKERNLNRFPRRILFENFYISFKTIEHKKSNKYDFTNENIAFVDRDKINLPIKIRHRKFGDKFYPLGMNCPKKLKDFFIDLKVPRFERDSVIIIADSNKIIWVATYRIDERVKITENTKHILRIKLSKKIRSFRRARRKKNR